LSDSNQVAWRVQCTAWGLIHRHEIIATIPSDMLTSTLSLPQAGGLQIRAIDLILKGMGVFQPSNAHFFPCFVKYLTYISVENHTPLPKMQIPGGDEDAH
jgi:hypothetical protein